MRLFSMWTPFLRTKLLQVKIQPYLVIISVLLSANVARSGDLMPPAGPVAPTMKTLSEVEPRTAVNATNTPGDADSLFKIAQPGSYYLTGNLTGVVGKHGIEITASGVTLDLMGFDLLGVPGSLNGVNASIAVTGIAVVNGSVRNWGADGMQLFNATNIRLTDLRASGNTGNGIIARDNAVVTGCVAFLNGVAGIRAETSAVITGCATSFNGGTGIMTNFGCTITNCSSSANSGAGIWNSFASPNAPSTITNCSTVSNTGDGIRVSGNCTVRNNACDGNGAGGGDGAGIHATNFDNRIEGNNCTINDRGIDVDAAGNFITRNTCSGNTTNWDVVAGNVCLVVVAVPGAAIVGDAGGVAPGAADPNANFSY